MSEGLNNGWLNNNTGLNNWVNGPGSLTDVRSITIINGFHARIPSATPLEVITTTLVIAGEYQ